MMSENNTGGVWVHFRSLNQMIDRVYEEKATLMNNALDDIKDKFGHLIDEDDSDSEQIKELLKPTTVTRIVEQTPAKDLDTTHALFKKSTRPVSKVKNLDSSMFSDQSTLFVSFEDQKDAKKTPLNGEIFHLNFDNINLPAPKLKNKQFSEFSITLSKPNTSMIKASIDTVHDIECPLGSSTPEDTKSKKCITKPKIEVAKKTKPVPINAAVDPKKRKREVLKQKTPTVEPKLKDNQARVKRQVVLKYEKKKLEEKKQEENTKLVKPKESKFKITPKTCNGKNTMKKGKSENVLKTKKEKDFIEEYNIDHVIEGASSDEEDEPKNQIPKWATPEGREYPANVQAWLNKQETVYKWFFNEKLKTPILEELFSSGVKTRSRTSSAQWHRPV